MKTQQMHEAQRLYFQTGLSNAEIADAVGVSRRILHYWIADNHWDRLRASSSAMPMLITEKIYHIMDQFTTQLLSPERSDTPITREEVDNLHKLSMTISKMKARITLNESMELFAGFTEALHTTAPALAEQVAPHIDQYITTRASVTGRQFRAERPVTPLQATTHRNKTEEQPDAEDPQAWSEQGTSFPHRNDIATGNISTTSASNTHTANTNSPANTLSTPITPLHCPAPPAKEKIDLRKQLRGTSTKGPGKSFHPPRNQSKPAA